MDLALRLADHGLRDPQLADALTDLAARNRAHPAEAARLYRAATEVGATALNARLADALALTGDCATAGRLADELLASDDPAERAAAVRIAASVAAHDGGAAQAAELFRWLGPYSDAVVSAAGAVVSIGVGDAAAARAALELRERRTTHVDRAGRPQPGRGSDRRRWTRRIPWRSPAWPSRSRPTNRPRRHPRHAGGAGDARGPARRRSRSRPQRHRPRRPRRRRRRGLRRASAPAAARLGPDAGRPTGRGGADAAAVGDATCTAGTPCGPPRCRPAIARRSGDSGAVQKHWYAAMEVMTEYSLDLYSLLPLGELWVAAARMRQIDQLRHTLDEAFDLLDALGNPMLWSLPLHWAGVHAGILANSPEAVAPHGQALTAAAGHSAFAKALATAGRTWLRVLANHVDVDEVTVAARSLAQYGLAWDATRLASQAALHTPDGRVSGAMLQLARDLKLAVVGQDDGPRRPTAVASVRQAGSSRRRRRGCPSGNARSPNFCCRACRTATSVASSSSRRRPSSTTSRGSGAGWAPSHGRNCCRCCARSWRSGAHGPVHAATATPRRRSCRRDHRSTLHRRDRHPQPGLVAPIGRPRTRRRELGQPS